MEKYKPGFLGKVIPADDPSKLTKFVTKQYDSFSKIYDTCKDQSEKIGDIKVVESGEGDSEDTLKIKVSADKEVVEKIADTAKKDASVTVQDDVITAKGDE